MPTRSKLPAAPVRERAKPETAALQASTAEQPNISDTTRLLHELEVHQIELQTQNEELRQVQLELEQGLARYTQLFDYAPMGYATVDAQEVIQDVNHVGAELLGKERARLVGRPFSTHIFQRDQHSFSGLIERALGSESRQTLDFELRRGNGATLFARVTASALPNLAPRVLIAFEDITDRHTSELQLASVEAALRESARHKDEFMAVLSHELRNPLTPIRNCLFILGQKNVASDLARRALATMDRQVMHLTRLIDDLLDVTRIGRGKIRLQSEHLDLVELVRNALADHQASFEHKQITLKSELDAAPLWVHADAVRITQVMSNLLGNAAKFTGPGGHVLLSAVGKAGKAVVRVVDNGSGIAPELLPQLFQPFTQAPQTIDRSRGGLGLGLSMVKSLVDLHGGTVDIASPGLGEGTEVTIVLPLSRSQPMAAERPNPERGETRARRVLVIEDNEDAADTLRHVLSMIGHEVEVAYDGPSGLELARSFHPEIVFCDIGLPGMDGYEVARAFRRDIESRTSYIVALTGYARPEDRRRAVEAGFDEHVAKPPSAAKLNRLLNAVPLRPLH